MKFKQFFIGKFKHLIDDIIIHYLFSENFASIEELGKKGNPMVNLSKFTSKKRYWVEL